MSTARLPPIAAISIAAIACGVTIAPPEGVRLSKPLTFSILEDYDKGEDLAEVARDFELFKELEVRTWRGSFGWDDYEPERGRYDFEWLHDFITLADHHGIALRPYIAYTPEWAAGGSDSDGQAWNQPPRDQAAWRAFVEALARETSHHRNVLSLEIYNEENVIQWWAGTRVDYAATLATAAAALRRTTRLNVLAGGLVYPDLEWVEDVCGVVRDFDVLPVHAYPETWTPIEVTVENSLGATIRETFVDGVDRACGRKPIWINETGYATTPGKSEAAQAARWVRAIATFAAESRVEHIGIYEIKDLAADKPAIGDAPNYHLGLTRTDRTRKIAFATVDMLTDLLEGDRITVSTADVALDRDASAGELHHHAFTRTDGDRILIIWNRTSDDVVRVRVRGAHRTVSEYALEGTASRFDPGEALTLPLRAGIPRILRFSSR